MKNLLEERLKDVQESTEVNTSYMGGSCLSLRAVEGHRVVVVEVYEAQNRSKVNASSNCGSCLSLRAMGEHMGVKTNVEENRGKYEFVENEQAEAVNQPTQQHHGGVQCHGGVQGCRELRCDEVMYWEPLAIARYSENMNSSYYGDREEVFGRAGQKLVVFPPTQADEVRGGQEEGHGEAQHDGRVEEEGREEGQVGGV